MALLCKLFSLAFLLMFDSCRARRHINDDTVTRMVDQLEDILKTLKNTPVSSKPTERPASHETTFEASKGDGIEALVDKFISTRDVDIKRIHGVLSAAFEAEKRLRNDHEQRVKRNIEVLTQELLSVNETCGRLDEVLSKTNDVLTKLGNFQNYVKIALDGILAESRGEIKTTSCSEHASQTNQRIVDIETVVRDTNQKVEGLYRQINVAQYKDAFQSSTHYHWSVAERAVDGNTDSNLKSGQSCTHTKHETKPWWMVDLGDNFYIGRVVIYNRADDSGERLSNFDVLISTKKQTDFEVFATRSGRGVTGEVITFSKRPRVFGRYLKIQLKGADYLQLCEVQAFYD